MMAGSLRGLWLLIFLAAVPWLIMYVCCFALYYEANPSRWRDRTIPYISGMLGDAKDDAHRAWLRNIAWLVAILVTVAARIVSFSSVGELRRILAWMGLWYYPVWTFTVLSAGWDAHPDSNPFKQWLSGSLIHFIFSLLFFVTGSCESYNLFLVKIFPAHRAQVKWGMAIYIAAYCGLFAVNKMVGSLSWMGQALLPFMEHVMLFGHMSTDSLGLTMLNEAQGNTDECDVGARSLLTIAPSSC